MAECRVPTEVIGFLGNNFYTGVCRTESRNPHHLGSGCDAEDKITCLEAFVRLRILHGVYGEETDIG